MSFLHEQLGSVYYVSNSIFTGKPGFFHNNSKNFQNTIIKIALQNPHVWDKKRIGR